MRFLLRKPTTGDRPRTEEIHLDSAMASDNPPPAVQSLLEAIAADPRPHEVGGFSKPLASFRAEFPTSRPYARKTWRQKMFSPIGATIAGVALALSGTAAFAYTGSLPAPAQDFAHTVIGAPAARPTTTPSASETPSESESPEATSTETASAKGTPVGPDATGPAAFGLCTAWTQHQSNGASTNGKADDSVAFKNLAAAAGGADKVAAYCANVLASAKPSETDKATSLPTQASTDHPGKPTAMPTHASTGHPGGKPTGLPTQVPTR